jgi:hypothetical protein
MWTEALPIVVYSSFTEAVVPLDDWQALYGSVQALKAHVQEYPGCQRFDVYFRVTPDERAVRIHFYTSWDTLPQLEAYLERGYTCERMIADLGGGTEVERSLVMEKIF